LDTIGLKNFQIDTMHLQALNQFLPENNGNFLL
jgi:hypothetical protein